MSKLAYLADVFCHLNKLKTGFAHNFVLRNKTDAFKEKLAH